MDPRLVIDGRPLVGTRTGIGAHTAEIAGRLRFDPPPLIASQAEITDRTSISSCRFIAGPEQLGVIWQQIHLPRIASSGDVLWGPHGTLPLTGKTPGVITMHDLTSLTMPSRHRMKTILSYDLIIGASIRRAAAIAAVSRTTADEVTRGFGVPARMIEIVFNGVDAFFSPGQDDLELLPPPLEERPYILYAGTLEARKGLADLSEAWQSLPPPRPFLVLAGGSGWGVEKIIGPLRRRNAEVMVTGYVSREVLRALYRHALLFVYPSRYEGFGLPPLEAMACGAPVISSDGGALREVMSGGAEIVPAGDRRALARTMLDLLGSPERRRELAARGLEHARRFTWESSAAKMEELFRRAAGS
jgi:glycosyltransferase involved in cell wall biosynthesis